MNFLIDESVDAPVAERLREVGHRVACVWDFAPGMTDDDVLARANSEGAILVTADKDFGELVFRLGRIHMGVLLVRLAGLSPDRKAVIVSAAVREHAINMSGAFTVVTSGLVRVRRKVQKSAD